MSSYAQVVQWGTENKLKGRTNIKRIFGETSQHFNTVRIQQRGFNEAQAIVETYSSETLELLEKSEIDLTEAQAKNEDLENIIQLGERFFVLYTKTDTKKNTFQAYGAPVTKGQVQHEQAQLLAEMTYVRSSVKGTFDFILSENNKELMVIASPAYSKYSREKFEMILVNDSLQPVWKKAIELPYIDQDFKIIDELVDEEGNVFLLTSYKDIRDQMSAGSGLADRYMVMLFNREQNKIKEFDLRLKEKWINGLTLNLTQDGQLMVGGFYSKTRDYSMAGTFFLAIDVERLQIANKSLNPFPREFLLQVLSEKQIEKGKELEDYYFDHFVLADDGSAYFTAEQYYVRTTSIMDQNGQENYTYTYYYNDIVVVKINPDAQVQWVQRIPKRQATTNDRGYYSSYLVAPVDDGIKILFNDHPKNFLASEASDKPKTMSNPQRSITAVASISSNGQLSFKPLFDAQDQGTILRPKLTSKLPNGKLLLYTQKGKTYRFAALSFSSE